MKSQPKIVLASSSPQRLKILKEAGFDPIVMPPDYEEIDQIGLSPLEQAKKHAFQKAKSVADILKEGIIIGCDTVVVIDGNLIGKPKGRDHAREILANQSGKTVDVISGLAMIHAERERNIITSEVTRVTFIRMTPEEIEWYLDTKEWIDKSGSFSVQGLGSRFVSRIDGDFLNVVGLPLYRVYETLRDWA